MFQGHSAKKQIVASYDYVDASGDLKLQVVRFPPKTFQQRRPDGRGGWIWNLEGVPPLIYRLPRVIEAIAAEQTIFIAEGEKDCDRLAEIGVVATCNAGGAGKWRSQHSAYLKGARVIILPDNDEAGRRHARSVASLLEGIASHVRILELGDLPSKGDVSDWIDRGGTVELLWGLVERTQAVFQSVEAELPNLEPWPILNSRAAHGIVGRIALLATADCRTAFNVLCERSAKYARQDGRKLRVYPEKSDKTVDGYIDGYYKDLKSSGMPFSGDTSSKYGPLTPTDFSETLYELRFKNKSSPMAQIADLYLYPIARSGYEPDYRPYVMIRKEKKLINDSLSAEVHETLGVKYSCFELVRDAENKKAEVSLGFVQPPLAGTS